MDIKRGDVYWWRCPEHNRPHLLNKTRPCVVVSNDQCNKVSAVITVCPLTTKVHKAFPSQVPVVVNGGVSIVLCDKITSVPIEELGSKIDTLKNFQMEQVDRALFIQLGLLPQEPLVEKEVEVEQTHVDRNKWNVQAIDRFCRMYEAEGPDAVAARMGLSPNTSRAYYRRFQKKMRG